MYVIPSMIDMGLKEGQVWPENEAYKIVASNLALQNPLVTNRDTLTNIVQCVLKIPENEIKTITLADLPKYGLEIFVG